MCHGEGFNVSKSNIGSRQGLRVWLEIPTLSMTEFADNNSPCKAVALAQDLGADEVVDYKKQSVDQLFRNNPFDAVVDQIGGMPLPHFDCACPLHTVLGCAALLLL